MLNIAEEELRNWVPDVEPIHSNAGNLGVNAMPASSMQTPTGPSMQAPSSGMSSPVDARTQPMHTEHADYPVSHESYPTAQEPMATAHEPVGSQTQTHATTAEPPYPVDERDHDHAREVAARVLA